MKSLSLAVVSLSLGFVGLSSAVHLPVQRVRPRSPGSGTSTYMSKQSTKQGLTNTGNILYTAEVKVGKASYTLQLDTGSSDLWFAPDRNYNKTFANAKLYKDLSLNLTYGTGWSAGIVAQTDVEFAGFNIKNQSFLYIQELSQWDVDFEQEYPIYQGIAGLSFDTNSKINVAVLNSANSSTATWGRSLMSNIFLSDRSTPNHIAFFLDRTGDLNDTDTGYFDIGTYAPGYEAVADMPKLEVYSGFNHAVTRWNVLVNGISINGTKYTLKSTVVEDESTGFTNIPPKGSIAALMDTGTSVGGLPTDIYHTLYKRMGGVYVEELGMYAVPCMAEANLEFTIGNQTVLVHPLDLTSTKAYKLTNGQNVTLCTSFYGPGEDPGSDIDIILGDGFLRNVYAVYNYGDFVSTLSGFSTKSPFIQILPLTDAEKASAEFKQARAEALAALPPQADLSAINDPNPQGTNSSNTQPTSSAPSQPTVKVGTGSPNAGLGGTSGSNLGVIDNSGNAISLNKLTTLVSVGLGLLGLNALLLVVLAVLGGLAFARLRRGESASRTGAYAPVALERERASEFKDEPVKYDTQFRD